MLTTAVRYAAISVGVMAVNFSREYSRAERINAAPMNGVTTAPTALNDCARFNRRSELSAGPRSVT